MKMVERMPPKIMVVEGDAALDGEETNEGHDRVLIVSKCSRHVRQEWSV